jgi:glycosyltransferase involved in cell wall biosynthesis
MIGQFSGPPTGEKTINIETRDILLNFGYVVKVLDSCLISTVVKVGGFSFYKLFMAIKTFMHASFFLTKIDILYATPGQSIFGILRFIPIIFFYILFKKRIYLHWHGYGVYNLVSNSRFLKWFLLGPNINHIYLTKDLHSKMLNLGGISSISYVLNNFNHLGGDKKNFKLNKKKLNVLYMGSLIRSKGINQFISASKICDANFNFHVCGEGDSICLKTVLDAQRQGFLIYHGVVTGEDKLILFQDADIFVLQTSYKIEGVPLALLEAMGAGCAVVTTSHNGIPETVEDSGVYLKNLSDLALVEKLFFLEKDRETLNKYQHKAYQRSKKFQRYRYEKTLMKIIESI